MAGMVSDSRHISERIDRNAADVYQYASDPRNLPEWAPGLGGSVENVDGRWFVDTPSGRVGLAFAERNEYGVLDHDVTLPSGEVIYNPMRVIADGDGCEVVFSLRRLPDMSDEDFSRDAGLVQADLTRLKHILEATD
ncbi:SRPBCC family protein [Microbispora corallina]|uniref:Polyketide cyclase n=2 Tax=Microbispora corallina TaxID=83302 RepID=A0ABQ4G7R2_9ACTN|nr:polyketide cyclase [Microbispora corallina]